MIAGFGDDSTDQAAWGVPDSGTSTSSTDQYDPGQAAWGIPDSGTSVSTPSSSTPSSTSTPSTSSSSSSSGTLSTILSILNAVAPKPTAVVAPKPTGGSMVLPIVLAVGGLGVVALLLSRKK